MVYIIPRPIVTAEIVNLSETPCTAQITACSFEIQKVNSSLTQHIRAHARRGRHRTNQHPRLQQDPAANQRTVAQRPSLQQSPVADRRIAGRRPSLQQRPVVARRIVARRPTSQQDRVRAGQADAQQEQLRAYKSLGLPGPVFTDSLKAV